MTTASHPPAAHLRWDEIGIDQVFEIERTFSLEDLLAFAAVSGDYSPLHVDPQYARGTEFGECVVHGLLLASLFSQLVGMRIPGRPALYLAQDLTFRRPVCVGETIRALAKVTARSEATRTLSLTTEIRTLDGKVAVAGTAKVKLREAVADVRPAQDEPPRAHRDESRRVALVTGASRGIGAAIARALARDGMAVAVNFWRSRDQADAVVQSIRDAGGVARAVGADVRDAGAVDRMVADIAANLGTPSVLVNAAIGALVQRPFSELNWSDFQEHLDYQVKAVFIACQALQPHFKLAGGGAVVNVLSQVTAGPPPAQMADYVTAKHALLGLSRSLAAEWAGDGVRVNAVSPGLTQTELTQFHHERVFRAEAARTPLKRLTLPDDVAQAVSYLAGDGARFLTGVNLFVTGGQVML
ncbi:MAG: SDR family oxidoreductase [Casimicrobiaceae bacterium]